MTSVINRETPVSDVVWRRETVTSYCCHLTAVQENKRRGYRSRACNERVTTRRNETVRSDEQLTARIEILMTSDNAVRSIH